MVAEGVSQNRGNDAYALGTSMVLVVSCNEVLGMNRCRCGLAHSVEVLAHERKGRGRRMNVDLVEQLLRLVSVVWEK